MVSSQHAERPYRVALIGGFGLQLLWQVLHFVISILFFLLGIAYAVESYLISSGFLKKYKELNLGKIRYLAIVIDSEDARKTSKVIKLLKWLSHIGVKRVCIYDVEGVLKKSKDALSKKLRFVKLFEEANDNTELDQKSMVVEFASAFDGKEALARAANLLLLKHLKQGNLGQDDEDKSKIFTESHMAEALQTVGCTGPEPDLLLVYGPARCHLGFPAWRLRYTEIVHMGPLNSMRYGSLLKAIYKFTLVRQNYGK